jgi:hypothetical protein
MAMAATILIMKMTIIASTRVNPFWVLAVPFIFPSHHDQRYCQNPTTEDAEKRFIFREFKNGYSLPKREGIFPYFNMFSPLTPGRNGSGNGGGDFRVGTTDPIRLTPGLSLSLDTVLLHLAQQ